ncbi:hypothetical protein ZHAS_00007034 [Anopheles sinensis]|uniref:Uncharacterized protein n=1 Tax=Anopheles sinensis TaxID=74873 RepID=A0A084VNP1_ANOSI|nr:hypothetical protein ZHAS_00007034 [Anopheles sinensis]
MRLLLIDSWPRTFDLKCSMTSHLGFFGELFSCMVMECAGDADSSSSVTEDVVWSVGCWRRDEQRRANLFLRNDAKSCARDGGLLQLLWPLVMVEAGWWSCRLHGK